MGDTAEVVAKRYNDQPRSAGRVLARSQQRTARAQRKASSTERLAPMRVTRGVLDKKTGEIIGEEEHCVDKDECNRPDTTLEGLAGAASPYFDPDERPGQRDRRQLVAALRRRVGDARLMSRERAEALGIKPKLVFRGFAVAGCEPDEMGIGPVFAVPKLLKRHGLKVDDIDLWELNEAFAVQVRLLPRPAGHRSGEAATSTAARSRSAIRSA